MFEIYNDAYCLARTLTVALRDRVARGFTGVQTVCDADEGD
jgi:hypothetical protein